LTFECADRLIARQDGAVANLQIYFRSSVPHYRYLGNGGRKQQVQTRPFGGHGLGRDWLVRHAALRMVPSGLAAELRNSHFVIAAWQAALVA